jgi:hypothetical protein
MFQKVGKNAGVSQTPARSARNEKARWQENSDAQRNGRTSRDVRQRGAPSRIGKIGEVDQPQLHGGKYGNFHRCCSVCRSYRIRSQATEIRQKRNGHFLECACSFTAEGGASTFAGHRTDRLMTQRLFGCLGQVARLCFAQCSANRPDQQEQRKHANRDALHESKYPSRNNHEVRLRQRSHSVNAAQNLLRVTCIAKSGGNGGSPIRVPNF